MYISLNWIKDYVDLTGVDLDELIKKFTLSCAEVEGVEHKGKEVSGVVTARIEEVSPHLNSQKLSVLKVKADKVYQVVCGAPGLKEGMIVPLARAGATLPKMKISEATVAGVASEGMCCSAKEIGFSDDGAGLFEFDANTPVGVDIKDILDIDDVVFEVDNKSLTNRPDLWGHYGIAREIAALTKRELQPLVVLDGKTPQNALKISVDSDKCFRYLGVTMSDISLKTSPINMQIRLYYCGMRAINFLTDLTNYIMLELGQPMHAFDNRLVQQIEVVKLSEPINFTTLDGDEKHVPAGSTMICSKGDPVAIAGVMGGLKSGINDNTTAVLIESANFEAYDVRKTASSVGLRTESSSRFEKSLDPCIAKQAIKRYLALVLQFDSEAKITSAITDVYNYQYPKLSIDITKEFIDKYIGQTLDEKSIIDILTRLEFKVLVLGAGKYKVSVPSFRATKDISGKADLVEEITRIYGYDNIVAATTNQPVKPVLLNAAVSKEYDVKRALAARYNYSEMHSYIWYDSAVLKELAINPDSVLKVVNSIQKDNNQIRSSITPAQLKFAIENKNTVSDFGIFEIGRVVKKLDKSGSAIESKELNILRFSKHNENTLVELKNALLYLFDYELDLHITFNKAYPKQSHFSPSNYYEVYFGEQLLGQIGQVHPLIAKKIDSKCSISVAEIDFSKTLELTGKKVVFEKISKYPTSEFDFNFSLPKNMLYSEVEKIAKSIKSNLHFKISLTDIYDDELQADKNYTINFLLSKPNGTITSNELEEFHKQVIAQFKENSISLKNM